MKYPAQNSAVAILSSRELWMWGDVPRHAFLITSCKSILMLSIHLISLCYHVVMIEANSYFYGRE